MTNKPYMSQFTSKPLNALNAGQDTHYALLEAATLRLVPVFMMPGRKKSEALILAGRAIAAYEPRHASDIPTIARIISSSFNALEAEAQAANPDLTDAEQAKLISRANTLHRTAQQAERLLLQRHKSMESPSARTFDRKIFEEKIDAAYSQALTEDENSPAEPPEPQPHTPESAAPKSTAPQSTTKAPNQTRFIDFEQRLRDIDSLAWPQPSPETGTIPSFGAQRGPIDIGRPQPAFTK
jgi:hypothetical protein